MIGYITAEQGAVPKWLKGVDCKSIIQRFESARRLVPWKTGWQKTASPNVPGSDFKFDAEPQPRLSQSPAPFDNVQKKH